MNWIASTAQESFSTTATSSSSCGRSAFSSRSAAWPPGTPVPAPGRDGRGTGSHPADRYRSCQSWKRPPESVSPPQFIWAVANAISQEWHSLIELFLIFLFFVSPRSYFLRTSFAARIAFARFKWFLTDSLSVIAIWISLAISSSPAWLALAAHSR